MQLLHVNLLKLYHQRKSRDVLERELPVPCITVTTQRPEEKTEVPASSLGNSVFLNKADNELSYLTPKQRAVVKTCFDEYLSLFRDIQVYP